VTSTAMITAQFKLGTGLLPRLVEGISDEHTMTRPQEIGNSINFIAGHVAATRSFLAGTLGVEVEYPWAELYEYGAQVSADVDYPSMAEILQVWQALSAKLVAHLDAMTEDDLSAESDYQSPSMEKTNRGAIAFLSFHEAYHLGQIQYLRRLLGYKPLFG